MKQIGMDSRTSPGDLQFRPSPEFGSRTHAADSGQQERMFFPATCFGDGDNSIWLPAQTKSTLAFAPGNAGQ